MHRIHFQRFSESRTLETNKTGRVWEVMVIKAGLSHNNLSGVYFGLSEHESFPIYYDAEMLKKAMPLFEGKPAYAFEVDPRQFSHVPANTLAELVKQRNGLAKNKVGQYSNPRWGKDDEGNEGIIMTLTLADDVLAKRMLAAWQEGIYDFVEYSIDGGGDAFLDKVAGQTVASSIIKELDSIDIVTSGAAGGKNLRLVAAKNQKEENRMKHAKVRHALVRFFESRKADARSVRILEADDDKALTVAAEELQKEADSMKEQSGLEKAILLAKEAITALENGDAETALASLQKLLELNATTQEGQQQNDDKKTETKTEPAKAADDKKQNEPPGSDGGSQGSQEQIKALKEQIESLTKAVTSLTEENAAKLIESANLPPATKQHLQESIKGRNLSGVKLQEAISAEQKYLEVLGVGNTPGFRMKDIGQDSLVLSIAGFFEGQDVAGDDKKKVPRFVHLKEMAMKGYGVRWETAENPELLLGLLAQTRYNSSLRFQEAFTSTTLAYTFADQMHKKLMKEYNLPEWRDWEKIVDIDDDVKDFRDHHYKRIGYWGELPDVDPDGGTYPDLPNLTDEDVTMNVSTKGGIVSITRKMIVNDDMRAIRLIPVRAARALKLRIYRAVFDILINNTVCGYDVTALIATAHCNKGSATLDGTAFNAARTAMFMQKAFGSDSTEPEYLGETNIPKWLVIHPESEQMALAICKSIATIQISQAAGGYAAGQFLPENTIPNLHQQAGTDYIMCPRIPDAKKTYWWALADPKYNAFAAVGFLRGQREPTMTQEVENSGRNFTTKIVSYCLSHDVGVKPVEHRAAYGYIG